MSKKYSYDEIYSIVLECKSSGLTEAQWCLEHGINPNTFYNWVSRLRKNACKMPDSSYKNVRHQSEKQDIVKLEVLSEEHGRLPVQAEAPVMIPSSDPAPVVITLRGASIALQNSVDPQLLSILLHTIGGQIC